MDPGRDRPRAVDRRHRRPDRPDAGRRHHRCRALGKAGRGLCGRRHRRRALAYAAWPIFPVIAAAATLHADGELRAGACDRGDQPRTGRTCRDRRTARAQCAVRLARQRLCRRTDGRLRLFPVQPLGVSRHLRACHSRPSSRCRGYPTAKSIPSRPMAPSSAPSRIPRPPASCIFCASARFSSLPAACCCCSLPTPRCCP